MERELKDGDTELADLPNPMKMAVAPFVRKFTHIIMKFKETKPLDLRAVHRAHLSEINGGGLRQAPGIIPAIGKQAGAPVDMVIAVIDFFIAGQAKAQISDAKALVW